jgi:hypothetical protein
MDLGDRSGGERHGPRGRTDTSYGIPSPLVAGGRRGSPKRGGARIDPADASELFDVLGADEVGARRQHLTELDEGRTELLEHLSEPAGARGSGRGGRLFRGRLEGLLVGQVRRQVFRAADEALIAVLADDAGDPPEPLQILGRRSQHPPFMNPAARRSKRQVTVAREPRPSYRAAGGRLPRRASTAPQRPDRPARPTAALAQRLRRSLRTGRQPSRVFGLEWPFALSGAHALSGLRWLFESPGELNAAVEDLGGQWDGFTTRDYTGYQTVGPPERRAGGRRHIGTHDPNPRPTPTWRSERRIVVEEMLDALDDDGRNIELDTVALRARLRAPCAGLADRGARVRTWSASTRTEDLESHRRAFYGAKNSVLCVAGRLRRDAVRTGRRPRLRAPVRGSPARGPSGRRASWSRPEPLRYVARIRVRRRANPA